MVIKKITNKPFCFTTNLIAKSALKRQIIARTEELKLKSTLKFLQLSSYKLMNLYLISENK